MKKTAPKKAAPKTPKTKNYDKAILELAKAIECSTMTSTARIEHLENVRKICK